MFLMLYFTNRPYFIFWLSLVLGTLGNMCIVIICCPVSGVINFEISLSFFNQCIEGSIEMKQGANILK